MLPAVLPAVLAYLWAVSGATAQVKDPQCELRVQTAVGGDCPWAQGNLLCQGCVQPCPTIVIQGGRCDGMLLVPNADHCKDRVPTQV